MTDETTPVPPVPPPARARLADVRAVARWLVGPRRVYVTAAVAVVLILLLLWSGTGYVYEPVSAAPPEAVAGKLADAGDRKQQNQRLLARKRQLAARLARLEPRGLYVVIDQTNNRLYLRNDDEVVVEAVCSAGSGMVLKEGARGRGRTWVFDTPRGKFQVLSRIENPVWRKPDWAFVEEGQPIPTDAAERFEYGTLGEYALYFGNGYMIHGTLYERLLGRSVTHGCIRLGREDLRKVWQKVPIGTPIFIY